MSKNLNNTYCPNIDSKSTSLMLIKSTCNSLIGATWDSSATIVTNKPTSNSCIPVKSLNNYSSNLDIGIIYMYIGTASMEFFISYTVFIYKKVYKQHVKL